MRAAAVIVAVVSLGCESGGHFTVLGYGTKPNYDDGIRTVYVPIFENRTYRRGVEFDLTREVIKAIELKTPYKVVSDRDRADTELIGEVLSYNKNVLNWNQYNQQRESEMVLAANVFWRDLRTGEVLSQPKRPGSEPLPAPLAPPGFEPTTPAPPATPKKTYVQSTATYIPEVGQSMATAEQLNFRRMANQIVAMMEKPW